MNELFFENVVIINLSCHTSLLPRPVLTKLKNSIDIAMNEYSYTLPDKSGIRRKRYDPEICS